MIITLPFPCSVNAMLGGGTGQRRFKSKTYKSWLEKANATWVNIPAHASPVHIHYRFYMPDKRGRDLSNYIKVCEDFIVAKGVLEDDNFNIIPSFSVMCMGIDKINPRVEIVISPLDSPSSMG